LQEPNPKPRKRDLWQIYGCGDMKKRRGKKKNRLKSPRTDRSLRTLGKRLPEYGGPHGGKPQKAKGKKKKGKQ